MQVQIACFIFGSLLALMPSKVRAAERPNIIVVMTDDQGYGDLSCHGNPDVQTPHLDQMYRQSVRFTNFHVDPTCAPTRAALITGRYSLSTGVWHTIAGRSFLHPEEVTMADVLRGAGYATGMFGKWHLGDNYPCRPHDRGFAEAIYHGGGGIGQTPDLWGNDYFDDRYFHNGKPEQFKGYCTDVWFDQAMRFMQTRRDEPFFCYLLPNAPHGPYFVDEKYSKPFVEKGFSQDRANFYGMLVNIDENFGRLDSFLESKGLRDNTLVLFMTDNGTAGPWYPKQGDDHSAGLRGIKGSIYEGGHRVPCFVRWPAGGITGGRDVDHLAAHIDVLPTLMELSGAERVSELPLHGRSLVPLLRSADAKWEHRSLVVNNQRIAVPEKFKDFVVMSKSWRLVGKDELYDLERDRGQQTNVADAHPDVVRELLKTYEEWWDRTSGRANTLVPITVGSDQENPAVLSAHDWHTDRIPWHQEVVVEAPAFNGHWEIDVAVSGSYRITLMQRPLEANHPIEAKTAVVEVGGQVLQRAIPAGETRFHVDVELKAGLSRLKSTFTNDAGIERGAYYVQVLRREVADQTESAKKKHAAKGEAKDQIAGTDADGDWVIESQDEWKQAIAEHSGLEIVDGMVRPTGTMATLRSKLQKYSMPRSAASIVFDQSPEWLNWQRTKNLGPTNLGDAPVMLQLGPDNYWMFGRYGGGRKRGDKSQVKPFKAEPAKLDGFDMPLQTTRFANQFDAPGGLKPRLGGYHAWQSNDMVNWVHHGPITEKFSAWMTTAEFADGKAYFYYDFPNDQDPHVYVDADMFDGVPGENKGMAYDDPSHGSDCAIIRDLDGKFHLIVEDWSPINAQRHAWDSPLAAHAVSPDGIQDFKLMSPPVDERTKPTGKIATYKHPHWVKENPERFKTNVAKYEVHEPEQNAYGDWAAISIGGQYYLFCDYDPAESKSMSVGWFTSKSIDEPFKWCGSVGKGHPDPDVMFAEGQFYLATQQPMDFVSPGPWVEDVQVRVGVDTDNDHAIDKWTDWTKVKESYDYVKGFSKQVAKTPAQLDLSGLPKGYGFQFEAKLDDKTDNASKPVLDRVLLKFAGQN